MPRVYVAGPLGFTLPTRAFHDQVLLPAVRARGFEPLDPWAESAVLFTTASGLSGHEHEQALRSANAAAGAANEALIRSCDVVLAVLDGVDVDSGTAAEIGFAAALGLPVIGWRSDLRQAGDNPASVVNLQVEHWLTGPVHRSLDDALEALLSLEV